MTTESSERDPVMRTYPVKHEPIGPAIATLLRPDPDTFVLETTRATAWPWLGGLVPEFIVVAILLVWALGWTLQALARNAWSQVAFAAAVDALSLTLLVLCILKVSSSGQWVAFNRRQGILTVSRRPFGWRRGPRVVYSRPLADIVAVQLIRGEAYTNPDPPDPTGWPILPPGKYDWYEFNLVLRDSDTPRMTLASGRQWDWMRQAGKELSEFLGVALVDQLSHGPPVGTA
jgi:hypothetical protein